MLDHGPNAAAAVVRMNPDGSAMTQTLLPIMYEFHLSSAILYDGSALYFLVWDRTQEAYSEQVLMKLDTETLQTTELHRLPLDREYSIEGAWEKGPLMVAADTLPPVSDPAFNDAWTARTYWLLTYGLASGAQETKGGWAQGETNTVQGNVLYYWSITENALRAVNTDTGEDTLIAGEFAPEGYEQAYIQRAVNGGRISIQFSMYGGTSARYYTVDTATGLAEPMPISPRDNITICAEGTGYFLVRSGEKWVNREKVEPDYVPGVTSVDSATPGFVSVPEYSLILVADFWAGERNFVAINDLVYGI